MEELPRPRRSNPPEASDTDPEVTEPTTTRWRVAVNVELVVEAESQNAAISKAEDLFRQVMPAPPLPQETQVEVVMSLPVPVGQR